MGKFNPKWENWKKENSWELSEAWEKAEGFIHSPVKEKSYITLPYGMAKPHPMHPKEKGSFYFHRGIDLYRRNKTFIYAAFEGRIVKAKYYKLGGNTVIMQNYHYDIFYMHMEEIFVKEGDYIPALIKIGIMGDTGIYKTGKHLHFEFRMSGHSVDPHKLLLKKEYSLWK